MADRTDILEITGKTSAGVIVKRGERNPGFQVFQIFTDSSRLELYTATEEILPKIWAPSENPAQSTMDFFRDAMTTALEKVDNALLQTPGR